MILATLISIPVFADVAMRGMDTSMLVMALTLMVLFYLLTINNILRRVRITDSLVSISGIFGSRRIPVEEIVSLDGMTMGTRQFVTLTTKKRNFLIPNSFSDFSRLIGDMMAVTPEEKQGGSLQFLRDHTVERKSDIAGAWITVLLLAIIILVRYFPR